MTIHESLTATEDAQITIETTADVINPVFAFGSKLVDEAKVHIDSDGISYTAVDPANVAMISLDVPAAAFATYDVEDTTVGIDMSEMKTALRAGRKRKGDEITLSVNGSRLSTIVQRDYDGTAMDLRNNVRIIDPDSIRQEPEIPDLELPHSAEVPRKLFQDVVGQVNEYSDHLRVGSDETELVLTDNHDGATAVVKDVLDDSDKDISSVFSLDYIKDAVKALKTVGADDVTIIFGDEMPVRLEFETELNGETVTGSWFQAPRIDDR